MSAMVIPTARVSGARRGSAAERAREAWFAGSSGPRSEGVPTPRRARPDGAADRTAQVGRTSQVVRTAQGRGTGQGHGVAQGRGAAQGHGTAGDRAPQAQDRAHGQMQARRTAQAHGTAHTFRTAPVTARATAPRRPQAATAGRVSASPARTATVGHVEHGQLRLTRRGRLVMLLLGALVLAGGIQGGQALADGPSRALEVTTYTVAAGETLWEIAAERALPGEDVRDVVLELQSLNGLASAGLAAGQQLVLPVQR